jgi:hypothetical protein
VAAVRVARRIGVVLEKVDLPADAFLCQALFGFNQQTLEDELAGAVVRD